MKVWIGHCYKNTSEWFVVWANDIHEAWDTVDEVGSPKGDSCREFSSPGFVNFYENYDKETGTTFSPAKDASRRINWLNLGAVGFPEEPHEYIRRLYTERESSQKLTMKVWAGNYLSKSGKEIEDSVIVWAKNRQEAISFVESKMKAKINRKCFIEIVDPGFINFHASCRGKQVVCSPPKDDLKNGTWINTNVFAGPEGEMDFFEQVLEEQPQNALESEKQGSDSAEVLDDDRDK
jgi:hypothetical protein